MNGPCARCGHDPSAHAEQWGASCQHVFQTGGGGDEPVWETTCGCPGFRAMVNPGHGRVTDDTLARLVRSPSKFAAWVVRAAVLELIERRMAEGKS